MAAHLTLILGMELRVCFETSLLLNMAAFLCCCVFLGMVLRLNTNLILLGKWPRSSPVVRWTLFACFSVFFVQLLACNFGHNTRTELTKGNKILLHNKQLISTHQEIWSTQYLMQTKINYIQAMQNLFSQGDQRH